MTRLRAIPFIPIMLILMGMVSRLDAGKSPYVAERLQDPINWHPWSEETHRQFEASGKPGLISISHELNALSRAMAKETFRNQDIASKVNEHCFAIAMDKNEHPQIAEFFSSYVWSSKQIAEWPLTVFVTPKLKPIDGGGYFPPTDAWGSRGFSTIFNTVLKRWSAPGSQLQSKVDGEMAKLTIRYGVASSPSQKFNADQLVLVVDNLSFQYDSRYGGFSLSPKSISFHPLRLLDLAVKESTSQADRAKAMRDTTLEAMLNGAVRDFVHGGFFAASTEESWTIPDFRKSVSVQTDAVDYLSQFPEYRIIVEETVGGLISDFRTSSGLYSEWIEFTADAGTENEFHTWTLEELKDSLEPEEVNAFVKCFGIKAEGNVSDKLDVIGAFKGRNILKATSDDGGSSLVRSAIIKLRKLRREQYQLRQETVSSVITNSLVASALCQAGPKFAKDASELLENMVDTFWNGETQRLLSSAREGHANASEASSKGYALFVKALLDGKNLPASNRFQELASEIQAILMERFGTELGPCLIAPVQQTVIPANLFGFPEFQDGSGISIMLENLHRLKQVYPNAGYENVGRAILHHLPEEFSYVPEQFPRLIQAADAW